VQNAPEGNETGEFAPDIPVPRWPAERSHSQAAVRPGRPSLRLLQVATAFRRFCNTHL